MFERKPLDNPADGRIEPFKIIGDVYFVGCFGASSHLIDTGDGLIVIDTGYINSFYLVIRSMYELGFDPGDVKYIINTHWHKDHTEATKALALLSGAKTLIGEKDADKARQFFEPDILVKEGDTLRLGNTEIAFMETPGHTRGTISLFFDTEENGKRYRVGTFGGAGANTLVPARFDYEGCRADYRNSIQRLRKEPVDVFIGNHVWNNNTEVFGKILKQTGENKFIDGTLWINFLDFCENRLADILVKEKH